VICPGNLTCFPGQINLFSRANQLDLPFFVAREHTIKKVKSLCMLAKVSNFARLSPFFSEAAEEYQQFNHHQKSPKKIIYELTKMLPGSLLGTVSRVGGSARRGLGWYEI